MSGKSVTEQVAENIGVALSNPEVQRELVEGLIEVRLADFFKPIVRAALGGALDVDPKLFGPVIIAEAVTDSITAPYLAKDWIERKTEEQIAHLHEQYGNKFSGLDTDDVVKTIALHALITGDEEAALDIASKEGKIQVK